MLQYKHTPFVSEFIYVNGDSLSGLLLEIRTTSLSAFIHTKYIYRDR